MSASRRNMALTTLLKTALTLSVFCTISCHRTEIVDGYPDQYVGVGMELTIENHMPVVVRTLDGGAAQAVGVEPGDQVVQIDHKGTRDLTLGNAIMMLRGSPGSQVTLTLTRRDQELVIVVPRRSMIKGPQDYRAAN
ncbi:MAG: PDZ domain-containing protein [Clostridia bacterium]|nr:PDZ domain-containing protein [Deltaproteobacteria bacterium]